MSKLKDIQVTVESQPHSIGAALALLYEIHHALRLLLTSGRETSIDMSSLPLAPADQDTLFTLLGSGEVEARLDALGKSIIRETGIAGVWVIEHFNADEQPIGKFIEVSAIPAILKSQPQDIQQGFERLAEQLATNDQQ